MTEQLTAVTHNGKFHADEVFATAVLTKLYPELDVIRSRDMATIQTADFAYDVGGLYDHEQRRYDHHQIGALRREDGLTRSAFGLIWLHYGLRYCDGDEGVWNILDRKLVRGIDAGDNAESTTQEDPRAPEFGISQMVELYNPLPDSQDEQADEQFKKAVGYAGEVLTRLAAKAGAELTSAREVLAAREESVDTRYAVLDHLVSMSDSIAEIDGLEYVLFPEPANNTWQVYAVSVPGKWSVQKRPLPAEWAGLSGADIAAASGVNDAIFCHSKRFLAVAKSREGAVELVTKALQ